MGFNLSEWALHHRSLVVFFMIIFAVAGAMAYTTLGREEDPAFAVNTMLVMTSWPGATTVDMMQQVTDRIERKLEETPKLDKGELIVPTKPGLGLAFDQTAIKTYEVK